MTMFPRHSVLGISTRGRESSSVDRETKSVSTRGACSAQYRKATWLGQGWKLVNRTKHKPMGK